MHPHDYSDPPVPEGINVQHDHPLLDFGGLLLAVSLISAGIILVLVLSASWLSTYIPFSYEQQLAAKLFESELAKDLVIKDAASADAGQQAMETYLQELATRIARAQAFPADMLVTVHYVESDTVNAFATLGGHIVLYSGLVNKLHSENALVLLLAHEMAHIKHRDPVVAVGRGVTLMLAISALTGIGQSSGIAESFVSDIGLLTALGFSRQQERAADQLALESVLAIYGHPAGAIELFEVLRKESKGKDVPDFLSSHPDTEERYHLLQSALMRDNHPVTPLPGWMKLPQE